MCDINFKTQANDNKFFHVLEKNNFGMLQLLFMLFAVQWQKTI